MQRRDLLSVCDDPQGSVVSARVVELTASRRAVDTVLRVRRPGGEEYLRHIEFEGRYRLGLELRLFEYAARLAVQFRLPVATTVMFLRPPAPRELFYREDVLQELSSERYTSNELERMIPKGAVMASGMFAKEFRQARVEGRVEGIRQTCVDIVRRFHPALVGRAAPAIDACDSLPTLRKWTAAAMQQSSDGLERLLKETRKPVKASVSRQRVTRPARRAARRNR